MRTSAAATLGLVAALALAPGASLHSRPAVAVAPDAAYARTLAALINDFRQHHGLPALAAADLLESLATGHSASMAAQRRLWHDDVLQIVRASGSRACVHNVGRNHATPEHQFDGWRLSPSHRRNLLDPAVVRMGLAANDRYVTFIACG